MVDVDLTLSEVLKRKEIYTFFSRSAFDKAVAYQAQGRVTALEVSDDLTHIRAKVRGGGSNVYRVEMNWISAATVSSTSTANAAVQWI